jgi:hypothetical protein
VPSDRVTEAVSELYAADPADFMQRRKVLADAARADGDKNAATLITALRKPTRAAWILNRLARADPGAPGRLETLTVGLRAATQAKDGRRLRELSTDRGALIDGLTAQALAAADVADPPAGLREDIAATLTSALADPDIAGQFATGTLTRAARWAGFGIAPAPDSLADGESPADDAEPGTTTASGPPSGPPPEPGSRTGSGGVDGAETATRAAERAAPARDPSRSVSAPAKAAQPSRQARDATVREAQDATVRQARDAAVREAQDATAQRARDAEDAAARRRKAFDDAKRSLTTAAKAATAAGSAEDHLEATVRDLEQRLTKARADLADARLRARRAEAAERKARQSLDRLPRPLHARASEPKRAFEHVT